MDQNVRDLLQRVVDNFAPTLDSRNEDIQEKILADINFLLKENIETATDDQAIPVYSVGTLKAALIGLPNSRIIGTQTVGTDHSAWNMHCHFIRKVQHGDVAVLQMSHPELKSLGSFIPDTIESLALRIIEKTKQNNEKSTPGAG